jgi:hypothetical protein
VIGSTVTSWLKSTDTLEGLSQKALAASRPASTTDIAREIGELIFGNMQIPRRKDTEQKFRLLMKKLMDV